MFCKLPVQKILGKVKENLKRDFVFSCNSGDSLNFDTELFVLDQFSVLNQFSNLIDKKRRTNNISYIHVTSIRH